ncbi:MAG TPA: hypothetical protein VGF53_09865 [Pseudolabrys sp.]|jgi:chromosome segregation ATPase
MAKSSSVRLVTESASLLPRSPERASLAATIERFNAATQRLHHIKQAQQQAEEQLYGDGGAIRAVERAEAALAEAKQGEDAYLANVALGEADASASPVKAAEAEFAKAQGALDSVRKTIAALKQELEAAERELRWATTYRDQARDAVVKAAPELQRLQNDYKIAQAAYFTLRQAMGQMNPHLPKFWDHQDASPYTSVADTWRTALKALEADADAPLPTG